MLALAVLLTADLSALLLVADRYALALLLADLSALLLAAHVSISFVPG